MALQHVVYAVLSVRGKWLSQAPYPDGVGSRRTRPSELHHTYAFPSGHTTAATFIVGSLLFVALPLVAPAITDDDLMDTAGTFPLYAHPGCPMQVCCSQRNGTSRCSEPMSNTGTVTNSF